ncbi:SUKH-4 family immunity protein [Streptomyces sp. NPDC058989]|uniref:SUKH-4 family immunity protein n=1 Tax=Streptomyces sp. NPDC058989 TaxID=3346686 RepID=UPI00368812A0
MTGPVGSGKTSCLLQAEEAVRETSPDTSLYVDCRGLSADEVATRMIGHGGFDERFLRTRNTPLADAFAEWTHGKEKAVVLFANVQWAGVTATSAEPERVLNHVVIPLLRSTKCPVAVLFEVDQEQVRAPLPSGLEVEILPPLEGSAGSEPPLSESLARFPQLRALAAAETREVPLEAWSALCAPLGLQGALADLQNAVSALPHLLTSRSDNAGTEHVGFHADGVRQILRTDTPLTEPEQLRLVDALLDHSLRRNDIPQPWRAQGPVAEYASHALPLHCAAAGVLADLAQDPRFLANVDRHALLTALSLAYPDGIPAGIPASDAHYLEAAGVEPATHEEWLSWLHWASLNRGATEFAEELSSAAGELPWLTRWSRWRPYGLFGPSPRHDAAKAEELVVGVADGVDVVASQLEIDEDELEDAVDPDADWYAVERLWSLDDGDPLGDAVQVQLHYDDDTDIDQASDRAFEPVEEPDEAERTPAPRAPSSSTCLVKATDGVQVHGGSGGIYALRVSDPTRVTSKPRWRSRPLLTAHNSSAVWPLPDVLRADAPPARSWYESAFGQGACHAVSHSELPDGLVHADTVRFLTEVGLPALGDEFRYLAFASSPAMAEVARPSFLPASAGPGAFFDIGRWVRGKLLLNGTSGQLFLTDVGDGDADYLVSNGLRQTCTLLALTVKRRQSRFTVWAEELDAKRSLTSWAHEIDPIAASHPHWTAILSGHWDDPDMV